MTSQRNSREMCSPREPGCGVSPLDDKLLETFIVNGYVNINSTQMGQLAATYDKGDILKWLGSWLRNHFPYHHYSISLQEIALEAAALRKYEPTFLQHKFNANHIIGLEVGDLLYDGKPLILLNHRDYYHKYNHAVQYFTDIKHADKARAGSLTPKQLWEKQGQQILIECLNKHDAVNASLLRDIIYGKVREYPEFSTTTMAGLIKLYQSTRILDLSGDNAARLMASMSLGVITYQGHQLSADHAAKMRISIAPIISNVAMRYKRTQLIPLITKNADVTTVSIANIDLNKASDDSILSVTFEPADMIFAHINDLDIDIINSAWKALTFNGVFIIYAPDIDVDQAPMPFIEVVKYIRNLSGEHCEGILGTGRIAGGEVDDVGRITLTSNKIITNNIQPLLVFRKLAVI